MQMRRMYDTVSCGQRSRVARADAAECAAAGYPSVADVLQEYAIGLENREAWRRRDRIER